MFFFGRLVSSFITRSIGVRHATKGGIFRQLFALHATGRTANATNGHFAFRALGIEAACQAVHQRCGLANVFQTFEGRSIGRLQSRITDTTGRRFVTGTWAGAFSFVHVIWNYIARRRTDGVSEFRAHGEHGHTDAPGLGLSIARGNRLLLHQRFGHCHPTQNAHSGTGLLLLFR